MAWRKLNSSNFLKPRDYEVGDVMILGSFVGTRPTQYGEAFDFKSEDGTMVSIHGYPPIATQLEGVDPGTLCRITYEGTKKSKNAYKYHNFSVEISDGGTLEDMEDDTVVATPVKSAPAPLRKGKAAAAPVKGKTAVTAADEEVELEDDDDIEDLELDDEEETDTEVEEVVKPKRMATPAKRK